MWAYGRYARGGSGPLAALMNEKKECGRTAYPSLTGQQHCGTFTINELATHPHCNDAEQTRPICTRQLGHMALNGTAVGDSVCRRVSTHVAVPPPATI